MWAGRTESDVVDVVISSRIVVVVIASPPSLEVVKGVSGGLRRQTCVLVGRGENLTRRVGTLLLMTAEEFIVAVFLCCLRYFFLRGEWQTHDSGFAVAHTSDIPLQLRRQNRELAPAMGR